MVKSVFASVAATAAVYGAARAFVPAAMGSSGELAQRAPAFRGESYTANAAGNANSIPTMAAAATVGAAAVSCVAAAAARSQRSSKVVRNAKRGGGPFSEGIGPWGPVGLPSPDAPKEFAGGLVGSDYAGFGGRYEWDPVGFAIRWPEHLAWYREAELKHGRIAMLAFAGLLAPDVARFPMAPFTDPNLDFVNAHDALVANFGPMWWLLIACGGAEYQRFKQLGLGLKDLSLKNAGDLGWFELPKNPELALYYQTAELKNGRLAMLAVSGIFTAGVFWDQHHFPFVGPA